MAGFPFRGDAPGAGLAFAGGFGLGEAVGPARLLGGNPARASRKQADAAHLPALESAKDPVPSVTQAR